MGLLDNKTVLITGATSGIGWASAVLFANEGARVIAVGRNIDRGKKLIQEIQDAGGECHFITCDISHEENIKELRQTIETQFFEIDILFNNAGIWITEPIENINEDVLNKIMSIDFNSVLFMTKHFISMICKRHGVILNNASIAGMENYTNGSKQYMYGAAKAGVIKISKLTAKNHADEIRVNCICPGLIETEIFENRDFSRFDGKIPMGRMGKAEEVAKTCLFLVSDWSSYITGAVIPIDGGKTLV